jgi:hypothetical protein
VSVAKDLGGTLAVRARTQSELGAEGAVEIRDLAEAAVEGDIENPRGLGGEPKCGAAQAGAHKKLMGRHTGQRLEGAQEMVGTEPGLAGKAGKGKRSIRLPLDRTQGTRETGD